MCEMLRSGGRLVITALLLWAATLFSGPVLAASSEAGFTPTSAAGQAAYALAEKAQQSADAAESAGTADAGALATLADQEWDYAADVNSGAASGGDAASYISDSTAASAMSSAVSAATGTTSTTSGSSSLSSSSSGGSFMSAVESMVQNLQQKCWSCDFYVQLVGAMDNVFQQAYAYLNGLNNFLQFVALCIVIVVCWKAAWLFTPLARDGFQIVQKWEEIINLFMRTMVVFTVFLTVGTANSFVTTSSNDSQLNPVRDFFFDGPLYIGTAMGCALATKAWTAEQSAFGGTGTGAAVGQINCSGATSSNWLQQHEAGAKAILQGFHSLGVIGIGAAMRGAAAAGGNGAAQPAGFSIGLIAAALPLAAMFVGWTIGFGLRYCDVALRAMVSLALFPVFAALWIFDQTRPIAHIAMKSVFFMMALFAISGLSFGMALYMLDAAMSAAGIANGGDVTIATGNAQTGFYPNIMAIAVVVGTWGSALGVASMSFKLAEEIISFEGRYVGEMGVGSQAGAQSVSTLVSAGSAIGGRMMR